MSLWSKLSGSINFYIRNVWKEDLLKSNEELLEDYLESFKGEDPNSYEYLDKQSYEFIKLTDEDVSKIKTAFIERIEKKKIKYEDEIDRIRLNKYIREAEEDLEENECKVIEFKKYKK